ncbi:MAG: 5-formyltetrahydrofolate cyclo-ligase [Oscillospiraceae bacterium]|nr:MAG: 5-formyltetrahydrofolate cyclo-ligase [Oscillospiraceae bacterium]
MQIRPPVNLKEYKTALRTQYKALRREMPPESKAASDHRIAERLVRLNAYRRCSTLLIYVSSPIEVQTSEMIAHALANGKRVAVPRCVPGTREMEFYFIEGEQDLSPGAFGIPEPVPDPAKKLTDWSGCFCVVPALACDRRGFRLGYGGGYYDRFLRAFPGTKAVILYKKCLVNHLWHGRYDVAVDLIVTEYYTYTVSSPSQKAGTASRRTPAIPRRRSHHP